MPRGPCGIEMGMGAIFVWLWLLWIKDAAGDAVELAEERVREARFLLESARSGRHPRQAIAARRLRCAAEEAHRACLAANAAGDDADAAADECDACNAGLRAAEDRADNARERLRAVILAVTLVH